MGYSKDLGSGTVHRVDPRTGYPMDQWGHLLDPQSPKDGKLVPGWNKKGTILSNLTSPYGFLEYATGSTDDFVCFDYRIVNDVHGKRWIILHAARNSETAGFIEDAGYELVRLSGPLLGRTTLKDVVRAVYGLMDKVFNEVRHDKSGWNQDHRYFLRSVMLDAAKAVGIKVPSFSNREKRFGGSHIDKFLSSLMR